MKNFFLFSCSFVLKVAFETSDEFQVSFHLINRPYTRFDSSS